MRIVDIRDVYSDRSPATTLNREILMDVKVGMDDNVLYMSMYK